MREILFRGKQINNSEWIEGYLVKLGRESFSDPERYGICNKAIPIITSAVCYNLKIDEVIPETVGQYTGLTDKNGKKIFEGDIVEYQEECGEIVYSTEEARFNVEFDTWCTDFDHIYDYEVEVIDNIHDNPELLKDSNEDDE